MDDGNGENIFYSLMHNYSCIIIQNIVYLYLTAKQEKHVMIKIGILGASGYSGAELLKLLLRHPQAEVCKVFANSSAGKRVDEVYPFFMKRISLVYEKFTPEACDGLDLVFIALPSGESPAIIPALLPRVGKLIDLGGDFRLTDPVEYKRFYKREHSAWDFVGQAVYGLPEFFRKKIKEARFVTNPGCYPTSAILGIAPALSNKIVEPHNIIVSSLSGVSGSGRSSSNDMSFAEINESVRAYKVGVHQHTPEIRQTLSTIYGKKITLTFVPHLLPITRGIYSSMYMQLKSNISTEEVRSIYNRAYSAEPFVRVLASTAPDIKNVNYTNYCDLGVTIDEENNTLIVLSVIDNLIKGAAGQAIQNMNIMFNLPETTGLL